ncbi:MAG: YHS domain-containing protein [Chloroherpetonaceae bacterium]|nr:YHS domain-containing protein [Chthonomonadaceae bacterium]MDW8208116.1 YHS domain-containing protein [Chloroherpetonaceae bacterium]
MARCPVCGTDLDPELSTAVSSYSGEIFVFCSEQCQQAFERDPTRYLRRKPER